MFEDVSSQVTNPAACSCLPVTTHSIPLQLYAHLSRQTLNPPGTVSTNKLFSKFVLVIVFYHSQRKASITRSECDPKQVEQTLKAGMVHELLQ